MGNVQYTNENRPFEYQLQRKDDTGNIDVKNRPLTTPSATTPSHFLVQSQSYTKERFQPPLHPFAIENRMKTKRRNRRRSRNHHHLSSQTQQQQRTMENDLGSIDDERNTSSIADELSVTSSSVSSKNAIRKSSHFIRGNSASSKRYDDKTTITSELQHSAEKSILHQLIECQDWQRVLIRLELYPHEIYQYLPIRICTVLPPPPTPVELQQQQSQLQHEEPATTLTSSTSGSSNSTLPTKKQQQQEPSFFSTSASTSTEHDHHHPSTTTTTEKITILYVTPLHFVCALNPPCIVVTTILRLGKHSMLSGSSSYIATETTGIASIPICSVDNGVNRMSTSSKLNNKMNLSSVWQSRKKFRKLYPSRLIRGTKHSNQLDIGTIDESSNHTTATTSSSPKWQHALRITSSTVSSDHSTTSSNTSNKKKYATTINFRFSFDDYKRRVMRHHRGGAFPMVEEEDGEESDQECNYQYDQTSRSSHNFNVHEAQQHDLLSKETTHSTSSSIVKGNIVTTAATSTTTNTDCSQSYQSSTISTTSPPRSSSPSFLDHNNVILQLSTTGNVQRLPLRMIQNTPEKNSVAANNPSFPMSEHTKENSESSSSLFRTQWDYSPLLQHIVEDGNCLPLHIAVLYAASPDILRELLEAHPLGALCDVAGMLPIHFVAAGWMVPPLLPPPISILEHYTVNSDLSDTTISTFSPNPAHVLESLTVLHDAAPDSSRIRSGNNGMTPYEYIHECMYDGPCKDACLEILVRQQNTTNDSSFGGDSGSDIFDFHDTSKSSDDDDIENQSVNTLLDGMESSFHSLSSLVAARDWESIKVVVAIHPPLASKWIFGIEDTSASIYKRLLLHCTCVYGGPIDLISTLIKFDPSSVETIDPTDMSTPLSLACFANASIDIIRLLVQAYPKAIEMVNVYGQVPLHVAVLSKASYSAIELLVEERPNLVLLKDNDGATPINYAKMVYGEEHTVYEFLCAIKDVLSTKNKYISL